MELLQQQVPSSGHRANGSLEADLPMIRRRRGRRKNVEGLELLFMGNKRTGGGVCSGVILTAGVISSSRANIVLCVQEDVDEKKVAALDSVQEVAHPHRGHSVPEQSPSARSLASGSMEEEETAISNKDLGEWLRQHPSYMDMPGFTPVNAPHFHQPVSATV